MGLFGRRRGGRVIEPEYIVSTKELLAIPLVVTKELLAIPIVYILNQCLLKTTGGSIPPVITKELLAIPPVVT
jgi:hypothetical protein